MISNYEFSLFPSASCVASLLALGLEDGVGNRLAVVDAYAALFLDSSNFFCGVTILLHDFLGVVADGLCQDNRRIASRLEAKRSHRQSMLAELVVLNSTQGVVDVSLFVAQDVGEAEELLGRYLMLAELLHPVLERAALRMPLRASR